MGRVHVIGGGLAGLSAAVTFCRRGRRVILHEQAGWAGGRARSFFDTKLGVEIDNGNHLLFSGNRAALAFLDAIGARAELITPAAGLEFFDMASDRRWLVPLGGKGSSWKMLAALRAIPGVRLRDHRGLLRLLTARRDETIEHVFAGCGQLYRRFWEPLAVAALNTPPDSACARALWPVLAETFARGPGACAPLMARGGLTGTFIRPALDWLAGKGSELRLGHRIAGLEKSGQRIAALYDRNGREALGDKDAVVLAVPPRTARRFLPELKTPTAFMPIVNAHFRLKGAGGSLETVRSGEQRIIGIIGATAQWLFVRGEVISVTVSAAERLAGMPSEDIAALLWSETARTLGLRMQAVPAARIIKEQRATFAATAEQLKCRPGPVTPWRNLALAGDWTDTGLPATIEGAIRSGQAAAKVLLQSDD